MDKLINSSFKTLEVIWNRKTSNHKPKLLPELKGINIGDSVVKLKKSANSPDEKINKNPKEHVHKRVKRSLFQENKNEKVFKHSDSKELNQKHCETFDVRTNNLRKRTFSLYNASQLNCPTKSPQIESNRKKIMRNQDVSLSHSVVNEVIKPSCSINQLNSRIHLNIDTSIHKPKLLPELKGINIGDSVVNVKKSDTSPGNKINENQIENVRKRVKRSLFQENENGKVFKHSDTKELKQKRCETTFDCHTNNLRKRTFSLYNASQLNCPAKSPQIESNRKKIMRNQDVSLPHLVVNEALVIKPSSPFCSTDQLKSWMNVFGYSKSPEIMSNRKRYAMNNNLDKIDVHSYDELNMNYKCTLPIQSPEKLNENHKNVNMHISKAQSKLNSVHSEDVIESSEKITTTIAKKKRKKKNRIRNKKNKIKNSNNGCKVKECKTFSHGENKIHLPRNNLYKSTGISTTDKHELCDEINFDSLDIINTEIMPMSAVTVLKIKSSPGELKKSITILSQEHQNREPSKLFKINDDNQRYCSNTFSTHPSLNTKELANKTDKEHLKIFKTHTAELFNQNKDCVMSFITHSSEIQVIPATPEHEAIKNDNSIIQYSPETLLSPYVPLIEVDQSPKTPHRKHSHIVIQSVQTPPNIDDTTLPGLYFEPIASPTPSFVNNELQFKIDSVESPRVIRENDSIDFSPVINKKKSDSPSSVNCFDSAKKRKRMCKDGLRGKFRDLIHRKKSEACIREYEKSYKPKPGETALLNVIEAWKEFRTIVLLCYYMKSDKEVQKVLVTLDNCPIKATKNSIIRIYSPWLTIKSEITDVLLYIGIVHAEIVEHSKSNTRALEPIETFTDVNQQPTTVFQSQVLWKCSCSTDTACQCLGELSVYNYLQHMISH